MVSDMHGPTQALVRAIPRSYVDYYARKDVTVSLPTMQAQHAAYVRALEAAGLKVSVLMPTTDYPDCVFIEDTAVVWGGRRVDGADGGAPRGRASGG